MRIISICLIFLSMLSGVIYISASTAYDLGYKSAIRECESAIADSIEYNMAFRFSDGRIAIVHRQWPKKQRLYKASSFYKP